MEHLRKEYSKSVLDESTLQNNPIEQFKLWFNEALNSDIHEANAMILSTVGIDKRPSSRVVLLKGIQDNGFVFYTNYQSRKGTELEVNPNACLLFFWDKLERQVRIEGMVQCLDASVSDVYFYSRPLLSQIGAVISQQSQKITNRNELMKSFEYFETNPDKIKRPEHWGGYLLNPDYFEFWQGRENRLHDRLIYNKNKEHWDISRLAP